MSSVTIVPDGEDEWLVKVTDVYMSYPHLFEPYKSKKPEIGADGKIKPGKYGAKFCLKRDDPQSKAAAQAIHAKCVEMARKRFKTGLPMDRYCIRDGKQLTEDMFPYYVLSASEDMKPYVLDRRRNPVTDEDDLMYPGVRVNATVRLWVQDNQDYGKRINANLVGVQFYMHSERWGGRARPKVDDIFDDIGDEFEDNEYEGGPTGDRKTAAAGDGLEDGDIAF